MIAYVPYNSIDKIKYDTCLHRSAEFRVYAQSWFLDAVTEQWDLLVYKDYEAVMPLPFRRKWGLSYVFTPAWVQQLGIFSAHELSEVVREEMFRSIPRKFFLVDYCCNYRGVTSITDYDIRKNYVLPLDQDMNLITRNFRKNRKSAFKKDFGNFKLETRGNSDDLMTLYDKVTHEHQGHRDARKKLMNLAWNPLQ